jgi:hypothetical protein
VLQTHRCHGACNMSGFFAVQGAGPAVFDVAESAPAGADIPQQKEGGRPFSPAFAKVGAHGFLAHRMQAARAHERTKPTHLFLGRRAGANPIRPPSGTDRFAGFSLSNSLSGGGNHKLLPAQELIG